MQPNERICQIVCQICNQEKHPLDVVPLNIVNKHILNIILKECSQCSVEGYICISDLNNFRSKYIKNLLRTEKVKYSKLDRQIIKNLEEGEILSKNTNVDFDSKSTFGERFSDKLADFAGSWFFITGFILVLLGWIALNSLFLISKAFDPYPYILLNLMLSCIAAIQAPVILMSQNRQEKKDRMHNEYDYQVNLKAELEIRLLHEKIDHMSRYQLKKVMEIQKIQMEMIEDTFKNNKK